MGSSEGLPVEMDEHITLVQMNKRGGDPSLVVE